MTESYHFQIEPEPAKEALFRVGGVYRDKNGHINRIKGPADSNGAVRVFMLDDGSFEYGGLHSLSDGKFIAEAQEPASRYHLIPGELVERNGEWVTAEAPTTIGPFGSGASLKTDGSHITGRIEPAPLPASMTPTLDKLESTTEPKRPPLTWNTSTPFDTFGPGFKVRSDTGWMTGEDGHPLQRMTADSPTHGSAHLLAKP